MEHNRPAIRVFWWQGGLTHPAHLLRAECPLLTRVHIASLPADVGFVHFDFAVERPAVITLHGEPNPMVHKPGRLQR